MGFNNFKNSSGCSMVLFAFCSLCLVASVIALSVGDKNPNYPTESTSGLAVVDEKINEQAKLNDVIRQDDLSICERKKKGSIFVFGRCPDSCEPFSLGLFSLCAGMVQFGCVMQDCGLGRFSCSLMQDLSGFTVCPGDKVVLDSIDLKRNTEVKLTIDLKAPPLKTDFYLLSDATGSMGTAIKSAKAKFQNIVDVFSTSPNVAFGVGFYRDETELDRGFKNAQSLTTTVGAAKKAVDSLRASGGGDGDEANLVALYRVATDPSIGWRAGSRKILVYFGDFPGHEPTCVSGLPRLTREVVAKALKALDITVIAASFPPGLDRAPIPFRCGKKVGTGQAKHITSETNGKLVPSSDQAKLVEVITNSLKTLPRRFDVDDSECKADIKSVHTPPLPIKVPFGEKTTVMNLLELKPSICEAKGKFECNYKYTESGADLKKTTIEIVNIKGCPTA